MAAPLNALVVEPRLSNAVFLVSTLSAAGYRVTAADFVQAKARLSFDPPELMVVDVHQGEFNGLHLVIRGQSMRAGMGAIVTCSYSDVVLERETAALGAAFMVLPTTVAEVLAAAARTVWRNASNVEPVRAPFERRRGERRLAIGTADPERRQGERRRAVTAASV